MNHDLERLLREANFRYTKTVDENGQESFSLPFDLSSGPLVLYVRALAQGFISAYGFVRTMDEVATASRKRLLEDLLRLNSFAGALARVFIWSQRDEEADYIGVVADVPQELASSVTLVHAVLAAAEMADRVLKLIAASSASPTGQLT